MSNSIVVHSQLPSVDVSAIGISTQYFECLSDLDKEFPGAKTAIVNYLNKNGIQENDLGGLFEAYKEEVKGYEGFLKDVAFCEFFKDKMVGYIEEEHLVNLYLRRNTFSDSLSRTVTEDVWVGLHIQFNLEKTLEEYNALVASLGKL